jgi:hypothetical protein
MGKCCLFQQLAELNVFVKVCNSHFAVKRIEREHDVHYASKGPGALKVPGPLAIS